MRAATGCFLFIMLFYSTSGAETLPSKLSFAVEAPKLRVYEVEIPHLAKSVELSTAASRMNIEADIHRFKTMNDRDLLDLTPRREPPIRVVRFFNALLPAGGMFAKNPNAPPSTFTR